MKYKIPFSNSGINKVAIVNFAIYVFITKKTCQNATCISLLWINEIIRYHLPIVDLSTMGKCNHKVSFTHSRHA
jgi:hypothetical protein